MTSYKIQSHKLQIFQNVREMKVSVLGKNFGTANQFLEPKTKISFGRTLGAKLPQSHMWYWVYNCVYNWLNLEKITFFFLQLQSCDRHSITFRNHLKYIQVNSLEKVLYVQYCTFKKWQIILQIKGQTKSKWFFQADVSSNERTNKFNFTTMIPLRSTCFLFVFWKKLKTPKRHFEINWPLENSNIFVVSESTNFSTFFSTVS